MSGAAWTAAVNRQPLRLRWCLLLALLAGLLAGVASHQQWPWRADAALFDRYTRGWTYSPAPTVLIVAIDLPSLQRLGPWPWPRAVHARLLDRLTDAGVERVALDLALSEPDVHGATQDAQLAAAIRRNGRVVLPVQAVPGSADRLAEERLPIPLFAASAAALGHDEMAIDPDGIARGLYLRAGSGAPHWPALAMALADLPAPVRGLRNAAPDPRPYRRQRDDYVRLHHAGPPGTLPQVSFIDVLDGRIDHAALQGRHVLVGVTATGIGAHLRTPTTGNGTISRTEYQADAASTLLQSRTLQVLSPSWQTSISAALAALCMLALAQGGGVSTLAITVALPAPLLLSFALLRFGDVWWAPAAAAGVMLLVVAAAVVWRVAAWQHHADVDALTGLGTRCRFDRALQQECDAGLPPFRPLALVLIELDPFKDGEDHLVHQADDRMRAEVARCIAAHARRPRDVAARIAEDAFGILLPDTLAEGAREVVEDLARDVRRLQEPGFSSRKKGPGPRGFPQVTLSVGVYCRVPDGTITAGDFAIGAEAALRKAKANGGDGHVLDGTD